MANRESDIPSQQQPENLGWYIPGPPGPGDNPQIPPSPPGSRPASSFVVTQYDARPGNAYDVFASLSSDLTTYTIPAGYVGVLRHMAITGYLESNPSFLDLFVIDRWGYPSANKGLGSVLDLRFDLIIDGTPVKDLSDFVVNDAAVATLNVACYLPIDENAVVLPQLRIGPASAFSGVLKYNVDCKLNLIPKTGAPIALEPTNKIPVWVKTGDQP